MTMESINMEFTPSSPSTGRLFFQDVASLIMKPGNFYLNLKTGETRRNHLTFLGFTAVIYSAATALFTPSHQALLLFLCFLNALLMPMAVSLALYAVLRVVRPRSYSLNLLLSIAAYANVALLFAWIPGFAPWAEIYKYTLIGLGLTKTGDIRGVKAFIAMVAAAALLVLMIHLLQYFLGI